MRRSAPAPILLAPVLLAAGCAAPATPPAGADRGRADVDARKLAMALEGRVAGKPESCIDQTRIRSVRSIGEKVLIYRMDGNLVYRNDPPGGCPDLRRGALVTRTPTARVCAGDIGQVRDPSSGISYGSCVFGEFVPYRPGP